MVGSEDITGEIRIRKALNRKLLELEGVNPDNEETTLRAIYALKEEIESLKKPPTRKVDLMKGIVMNVHLKHRFRGKQKKLMLLLAPGKVVSRQELIQRTGTKNLKRLVTDTRAQLRLNCLSKLLVIKYQRDQSKGGYFLFIDTSLLKIRIK